MRGVSLATWWAMVLSIVDGNVMIIVIVFVWL
jgi:hypothetical protein